MSLISDTSGESRGPMHSCSDCNTKECSNLAPDEIVDGVVGFLSFCPNWLALSFPGPKIQNSDKLLSFLSVIFLTVNSTPLDKTLSSGLPKPFWYHLFTAYIMIYPVDSAISNLSVNNWGLLNQNKVSYIPIKRKTKAMVIWPAPLCFRPERHIFCGLQWLEAIKVFLSVKAFSFYHSTLQPLELMWSK